MIEYDHRQAASRSKSDPPDANRLRGIIWAGFVVLAIAFAPDVAPAVAEAQQQAKTIKIGFLDTGRAYPGSGYDVFRREFRALGYVEGKNVTFEYRSADNQRDRLRMLAEELIRIKVDVILAAATSEALAAKNATRTIPIVFLAGVSDHVAAGLVDSLARPGENLTGFTTLRQCWLVNG